MSPSDPKTAEPREQAHTLQRDADEYFVVAPWKLGLMCLCTFGLYEIYWMYKQWALIAKKEGLKIDPFWRALFAPLFVYPLFRRLTPAAGVLAILYIASSVLWRLPGAWWLLTFMSALPLMMVQSRLNVQADRFGEGGRLSWKALLVVIVGALGLSLAVAGSFAPGKNRTTPPSAQSSATPSAPKNLVDTEIIQGVNTERQKVGSPALSYSAALVSAATAKANAAIASGDYTPGSQASIGKYLKDADYNAGGSALFVFPVRVPVDSSEYVQSLINAQSNKKLVLDGQYTQAGLAIVPVNKGGVSSMVVLYIAKPQAPVVPVYHSAPVAPIAPIYNPPAPVNCSSYYIGSTLYTHCY